jgi:hypothetical protein
MSKFEVLVQKDGRIQWMEVPGCINHKEARLQGEKMYAGKILQTRSSSVNSNSSTSSSNSSGSGLFNSAVDSGGSFALLVIAGAILMVISMWPIFLAGGLIWAGYKLYKRYKQQDEKIEK